MTTNSAPIPTYAAARQRAHAADLALIEDWLDDWVDSGRSKNGQQYARYVTKLSAVLVSQGATLPEASTSDLRAFIRDATEGLTPSTKAFVTRAVKSFFGWLSTELEIPNPAVKLKTPRQPWGEARTISADEHEKLAASITSRSMDYWDRRDVAMLEVAASSGMRISEICAMTWEMLDVEQQTVTIPKSKTNAGIRVVVISKTAVKAIKRMNRLRGGLHRVPTEGPIWISSKGGALSATGASQMLNRRCKAAGIEPMGWHAFRRRLLTRLISGDGGTPVPIVLVARSAGWSPATANLMASRYSRGEAQGLALEAHHRLLAGE